MLNDLVQIRNIDVRYGWRTVLKSVSLSVRAGEVWLLLGPNAAGKTTLLRTLAGSLKPAKGKIIFKNEGNTAKTIGWVDHQSFLYDELTVQENLQFWANLSAVDSSKKRIDELIERFDLALFRHEKFEVLSFGMKKRVTICRAILARPDLLLLDEAFNGLDQVGTERLTDLLTGDFDEPSGIRRASACDGCGGSASRTADSERTGSRAGFGRTSRKLFRVRVASCGKGGRKMRQNLKIMTTLIAKDWRMEIQNLQITPLMVVMAITAVVLFHFTGIRLAESSMGWAAALWLITLLNLVIILDRAMSPDLKNGVLEAMLAGAVSPMPYLTAKLIFTGSILLVMQGLVLILLKVMMALAISPPIWKISVSLILADIGLLMIGLVCSMIAMMSRHRSAILAGMIWPVAIPIVVLAVLCFEPAGRFENGWLILTGFDIVLLGLWPMLIKMITGKE
jgi:ABC-type transport system involved in cytochrome c biogenesis ATPase subunit/ABC-type transport system involved in cytochrome c biogenesis permease component